MGFSPILLQGREEEAFRVKESQRNINEEENKVTDWRGGTGVALRQQAVLATVYSKYTTVYHNTVVTVAPLANQFALNVRKQKQHQVKLYSRKCVVFVGGGGYLFKFHFFFWHVKLEVLEENESERCALPGVSLL